MLPSSIPTPHLALILLSYHTPLPLLLLPACLQVKGYRRILFCQTVRDDVDGALGGGAWASLLPRMCQGRLVPTPWLNKVSAGRAQGLNRA